MNLAQADCDALLLPRDLIDDVAGTDPHDRPATQLLSSRPHTDGLGAQLWGLTDAIGHQARNNPEAWTSPLLADQGARLLTAAALAAFPHDARIDPTIEDRRDAHPAALRRALTYVEAHLDQPVSIIDIARASHVTPRAVQLAFRRHLDTTPMAFIRHRRLEAAHRDLIAADPDIDTVTAIVHRWGFTSHSRFAAQYRATYGRPPSHTLQDGHPTDPAG